jgi:broad specificity phosphatase PhoE
MRHSIVVRACFALLTVAFAARAQSAPASSTTIILVRHAEKAAEPAADPPLSAAGLARADALEAMVKDAGIRGIVTTQFLRTRQTAAPTADKFGLTIEIMDARAPLHPKMVADSVLAKHRGQTVLVVGHSNTLPAIVAALGAPMPAAICDDEYDNIFVVTVPATGVPSVARMHYGTLSPVCVPAGK